MYYYLLCTICYIVLFIIISGAKYLLLQFGIVTFSTCNTLQQGTNNTTFSIHYYVNGTHTCAFYALRTDVAS